MKYTKYVTVKVEYDSEETWDETVIDIKDLMEMINNIKRTVTLVDIEQGVNLNVNDGQNQ